MNVMSFKKSNCKTKYFEFWRKSCETAKLRNCRKQTLRTEKTKQSQTAVLSFENYAFEKLKTQRILRVE